MAAPRAHMVETSVFSPLARAVLDSCQDGIVVFDSGGKLMYANEAARLTVESVAEDNPPTADRLLPELAKRGGRLRTLYVGDLKVGEAVHLPEQDKDSSTLAQRERKAIIETLDANGWKLASAARKLGISRTTLWRRLRAYGIQPQERKTSDD